MWRRGDRYNLTFRKSISPPSSEKWFSYIMFQKQTHGVSIISQTNACRSGRTFPQEYPQRQPTYNIERNLYQILLKVSTPSSFYLDCCSQAVSRFLTACLTAGSFIILNYTIQWVQSRREQLSVWEIEGRVLHLAVKRRSVLPSAGQETETYGFRKEITYSVSLA
jgi:hypothetical protein